MNEKLFSIGEFSKLKNVSIDTLRHYDKIDLLKPEHIDKFTSYRYYNLNQMRKYDIISFCKNLDIPLKSIKQLLDSPDKDIFLEILSRQKELLDKKICEFEQSKDNIDLIANQIESHISNKQNDSYFYWTYPDRYYLELPCTTNLDEEEILKLHENLMIDMEKLQLNSAFTGGFLYHLAQDCGTQQSVFECVCAQNAILSSDSRIHHLPSGMYLCHRHTKLNREADLSKFQKAMAEQNLCSPLILDFYVIDGALQPDNRSFEFQVRIS